MPNTYPGTTIEVSRLEKGSSKALFAGIFATGGITLSQVSVMTGLEPYMIQNWVVKSSATFLKIYSKKANVFLKKGNYYIEKQTCL